MAHKIENTPKIIGEDAKRFRKAIFTSISTTSSKKVLSEKKSMKKSYDLLVKASDGKFF